MKLINKYFTVIKYIISAGLSFALDIVLFSIFVFIFKDVINIYILVATVLARIISSVFNYCVNKNIVFKAGGKESTLKTVGKYYLLVITQMLVSATLVSLIYNLIEINETVIKIPVEIMLFIINYIVQKKYIFKGEV